MNDHVDGAGISAFLDGALGLEDRARVDAHLSSCASCRGETMGQGQPVGPEAELLMGLIMKSPLGRLEPALFRRGAAKELGSMIYLALAAFLGRPLAARETLENAYGDNAGSH